MRATFLKAVVVTVTVSDGGSFEMRFSVSEEYDPVKAARNWVNNNVYDDEAWVDIRITKVYAQEGESVPLKVRYQS